MNGGAGKLNLCCFLWYGEAEAKHQLEARWTATARPHDHAGQRSTLRDITAVVEQ